jgi:hypothetical protein
LVTCAAVAPETSVRQTWVEPDRSDRKSIALPSGDQRGLVAPPSEAASLWGATPGWVRSSSQSAWALLF